MTAPATSVIDSPTEDCSLCFNAFVIPQWRSIIPGWLSRLISLASLPKNAFQAIFNSLQSRPRMLYDSLWRVRAGEVMIIPHGTVGRCLPLLGDIF